MLCCSTHDIHAYAEILRKNQFRWSLHLYSKIHATGKKNRQLASGNFLDIIFSCPYELHELVASSFISELIRSLTIDQKEVLYYLSIRQYSTIQVGMIRGQTDRNIRKLRKNIHKKLQRAVYDYLLEKQNDCGSLTLRERQFLEEYGLLLKAYGKDAVILRENKSKPRKKKAALGSSKDSE